MKMTVCIPMYNESGIIRDTARTLSDFMCTHFDSYELIFVDDGSEDDSAALVEALQLPNVRVLSYQPNRGKGCAVRTGMLASDGDISMFIDADLAYGTDVIAQAAGLLKANPDKDVLIGSRTLHPEGYSGYTPLRKLASKVYIKVLNTAGGMKLSDSQCGCKAFRGDAAREIFSRVQTDNYAFDFEVILLAQKLGCAIIEMPVRIVNHRESKINVLRDSFNMLSQFFKIIKRVREIEIPSKPSDALPYAAAAAEDRSGQ